MNPRQIEAFRAVMLTGTTTRAAEVMHTSQPAISRLVAQLEARLRLRLFERDGLRLRATPEAKALMHDVERLFVGLDRIEESARSLREGRTGILSIASLPALGYGPLPEIIGELRTALPGLTVQFDIHSSADVRERVAAGSCEIGFAADEIDTSGIVARPIARRRALLALPAGHPLARRKAVSVDEACAYPFIALSEADTTQRRLNAALAAKGKILNVVMETPYTLTVAMLVNGGAGIGLVDPLSLEAFHWSDLCLVPIKEDIWFNTLVIHSASTPLSTPAKKLIEIAQRRLLVLSEK